jgi:hypothetical protein
VRPVGVLSHFIYLEDARNHKPKIQGVPSTLGRTFQKMLPSKEKIPVGTQA